MSGSFGYGQAPVYSAQSPAFIATGSVECLGTHVTGSTPGSIAVGTVNYAIGVQFVVNSPFTMARVGWWNGTVASGNVDFAVYNHVAGAAVLTRVGPNLGSTAQSGTSAPQSAAFALTLLPGTYYAVLSFSSATATFVGLAGTYGTSYGQASEMMGVIESATAFPLGVTFTPVVATLSKAPMLMMTGRTFI